MATIKRCDRCSTEDGVDQQVIAASVGIDLCSPCFDEVFAGEWFDKARSRVDVAPVAPANRARDNSIMGRRGPRPPQHGFTAEAIEVAQDPSVLATRVEVPSPADAERGNVGGAPKTDR